MNNESKIMVFLPKSICKTRNKGNIRFRPDMGYYNRYNRAKLLGCKFGFVVTKLK